MRIFGVNDENRNTVFVLMQSVCAILTMLLSYRIVLSFHSQELLGLWALLTGIIAVSRVLDFSGGTLPRFVSLAQKENDAALTADFIDTTAIALFFFYAAIMLIAWLPFRWVIKAAVDTGYVELGLTVLPFMLLNVFVTVISISMASALDGFMRADLRAKIMIAGFFIQVVWNLILIPEYGIIGFAIAQIIQFISVFAICRFLLKRRIPELGWLPLRWSPGCFRKSLGYGLQMQAVSLSSSFIEPAIRLFANAFGGLAFVALYDIANKIIVQVRVLAISAISPTVPIFAAAEDLIVEERVALVSRTNRNTVLLASVLILGASVGAPILGLFLLGQIEPTFIYLCAILLAGQFLTIPTLVQYFHALAIAKMKWNIMGLLLTGALTVTLSYILGSHWGGLGVAAASVMAAAIGSYFALYKNARMTGTGSITDAVPKIKHFLLFASSFVVGLIMLFATEIVIDWVFQTI